MTTRRLQSQPADDGGAREASRYEWRDSFADEYWEQGFVLLPGIVPDSLVSDLRNASDRIRELAHHTIGPQTQRIQPIGRFVEPEILEPFLRYLQLGDLHAAVERLFGPGLRYGSPDETGILVEPLAQPWSIGWHRDNVAQVHPRERDRWNRAFLARHWNNRRFFNQLNVAIYPDPCFWYVPGSHARQWDLQGEVESIRSHEYMNQIAEMSVEDAEAELTRHCRSMPGARQFVLEPGDALIHRNLGWHLGNYSPNQPRATIHDLIRDAKFERWERNWDRERRAAATRVRLRRLLRSPIKTAQRQIRRLSPAYQAQP